MADTPEESANLFADFFKSVYSSNSPPVQQETFNRITPYNIRLPLPTFTADELSRALASIDPSKGPGPDNLPPSFLKRCALTLAAPVAAIFNRSLACGIFPHQWKLASITRVHKSGNIHNVENYRPISILSCLPKVLEKMVHGATVRAVQPIQLYQSISMGLCKNDPRPQT